MTDRLTGRSQPQALAALRNLLANIEHIDPESPTYARICEVIERASDEVLQALASAEIRYLSALAQTRISRDHTAH